MTRTLFELIVGTILRSVVMMGAGWLVAHGMLPEGTLEQWVTAVVFVILGLIWSVYAKLKERWERACEVQAALDMPSGTTRAELTASMKEEEKQ